MSQERIQGQFSKEDLLNKYKGFLEKVFKPQITGYFENLKRKVSFPELSELTFSRLSEIFFNNNLIAHILESQEFEEILNEEKELAGRCKIGEVNCIDGRISLLHQFGRVVNTRETAGSLLVLDEKGGLNDTRMVQILEEIAEDKENRPLLEIITAHTSLTSDHKCGAIKKGIKNGTFFGDPDQVSWEQAKLRAKAIEEKYNDILRSKRKSLQTGVTITAMIDTDTMGLILNFDPNDKENKQGKSLSTTQLTMEFSQQISQLTGLEFGQMREDFTDPKKFIDYSRNVLKITKALLSDNNFLENINNFMNKNEEFRELSEEQRQALRFVLARTVAHQYITGLASKVNEIKDHEEHTKNPFSEHDEDYMVISAHGKPFGRFDISNQSFGSIPANRKNMIEQLKTKIQLLRNNDEKSPPYILFLSTPINPSDNDIKPDENAACEYFKIIFDDGQLKSAIEAGELVIIPILIDENSGRVLEVRDYSVHLN